MRRNLAKLPYPVIGRATGTGFSIPADFSTSSNAGGGGGGGRGRGTRSPFQFTSDRPAKNEVDDSKFEDAPQPPPSYGRGHGRGQPLPAAPTLPDFSSWLKDLKAPPTGRGRGFVPPKTISPPPPPRPLPQLKDNSKRSMSFVENEKQQFDSPKSEFPTRREEKLPSEISNLLPGAGRGKPAKEAEAPSEKPKLENRHVRSQRETKSPESAAASRPGEQLSQEEKVKRAVDILARGDSGGGRDAPAVRGGRGGRGRGGVRGRGRGRGRFDGRGRGGDRYEESDDEPAGLSLGSPEDEEKLAKKLGPKIMNELVEGFEEMSYRVLPSPVDDAYMDALHTNLLIECEPEYLMEEFGTNPDIDEKPPIPLRDALEKMKPFLMVYEGIESQEEWEEVMEETMNTTVPLMKEIVDYYSGPDRVTAKQQQEELERVAKTLPPSAPDSVKRFTDRAVLALQSNPGWGFDKKCQFMDKLVMEASKQYK